ncbi:MAG: sigma-54-dependent Fis family transcriptional regulator [Akkermansiaceae bacterium]|nr:sigma-54-dependent Fis family transcriptional regulator [Akkermansiaceae bacterium]NNM31175.1 sigma-54-dependent Fis family transcriptional regulator [Akkermansiaceae bacterium]
MAPATFTQTILLVDEDHDFLDWATKRLETKEVKVLRCDNAENAVKVIEKSPVDLVVTDIQVQPFDGLELLSRVRAVNANAQVVLTAGFPTTSQIIEATRRGARDVLRKESLPFELRPVVEAALQIAEQRRTAGDSIPTAPAADGRVKMIGISRPLQDVFKIVGRVAQTDAPILITGESGTGKELIARAVHEYSPRRKSEMIAINCGAIPENLLESELFGHEKGSFTGAIAKRAGRFEQCDGGTLFLDEIGDMPTSVQVKLLRVLQDGTFSRVGSNETLSSDVRILAATNKDLAAEVAHGNFREDLYYRLNVVEIKLPPLRERPEDIPLLAEFFLQRLARKYGMARIRLSGEAGEALQKHNWPGNVRELENTIARACALATTDLLLPEDIPFARAPISEDLKIANALDTLLSVAPDKAGSLLAWTQRELAGRVLAETDGDLKEAARRLGATQAEIRKILGS